MSIKAIDRKSHAKACGSAPARDSDAVEAERRHQRSFMLPVAGSITSRFGMRVHPILGTRRLHTGVDIAAAGGTPVKAANDGVVVDVRYNVAYGRMVKVDHGNGIQTWYCHLSAANVRVGEMVARGQKVGAVGSTGWSTGNHLHFEMRINGRPVNPLQVANLRPGDLSKISFPAIAPGGVEGVSSIALPQSLGGFLLYYLSKEYSREEPVCGEPEAEVEKPEDSAKEDPALDNLLKRREGKKPGMEPLAVPRKKMIPIVPRKPERRTKTAR